MTSKKENILIIGANSDIARATARYYAKQGYSLSLAARNVAQLDSEAYDIRIRYDCTVDLHELDVVDLTQRNNFVKELKTLPDTVLFAAGYLGDQEKAQADESEVKNIFEVNLNSAIALINYFANQFEQRAAGSIIAITSVAGDRGRKSNYFYGTAKAALSTYLSGLRNRLYQSNVTVLDVKPGFVDTKMTGHLELPKKLTSTPEQVAKCIFNADSKNKHVVYIAGVWRIIMLVIKLIPEMLFKRLSL